MVLDGFPKAWRCVSTLEMFVGLFVGLFVYTTLPSVEENSAKVLSAPEHARP